MSSATSIRDVTLCSRLAELLEFRRTISIQPYSIVLRLRLAKAYQNLGYPDLAASEAYRALLLIDELIQEGEYFEKVLTAAQIDTTLAPECTPVSMASVKPEVLEFATCDYHSIFPDETGKPSKAEQSYVFHLAKSCWSHIAYSVLVGCLMDCGCLRSAFDYNARASRAFPRNELFLSYQEDLRVKLCEHFDARGENMGTMSVDEYPDKGYVRREQYPWNDFEPERFSKESIQFLNSEMKQIAPQLEVKVTDLPVLSPGTLYQDVHSASAQSTNYTKQLGVFAREDIPPGEVILQEKSLLTAVSRFHESFCDACSASLSNPRDRAEKVSEETGAISCEECMDVFFCSTDCHDLAQEHYHPALCGTDVELKVPPSEAADALYSLLLIRALALAEVRDVHPLELKEVRYIWGDYHGLDVEQMWRTDGQGLLLDPFSHVTRTLPFSFTSNILMPIHMLEKMDINIYEQSQRYDTWIFNTLYAKFRGTASGRQGLDGRPEIGAVHPMWCLANHSCDPNVAWEWQGSIKFWTREELVEWGGRDSIRQPGILKGEEVFSHYCDIRLPVKERREWAVGALGGECMCQRCAWEENEATAHQSETN